MVAVLEARPPEKTGTSSSSGDWPSCFDRRELFDAKQSLKFPEFLIDFDDWRRNSQEVGTARIIDTEYVNPSDFTDEIKSPVLPPKNKFHIKLNIKSIKRGRPSSCDEIES